MKLAFARLRLVAFLSVVAASFVVSGRAHAETAEARAAVMLRDKPAANGRVIERLAAGSKLVMVEMSADGGWARVKNKGGREGWVPVASIRTKAKTQGDDEDAPRGEDDERAKRRNVRPEAWVSKSKYHEEDNKMTVVASKAELYGRPQASGTILGIVRRGEIVQFVRKSADKKWIQIDIGAGELAWVDAKAVRQGADMGRADEEPDEPRRPTARNDRNDEPPPVRRKNEPRDDEPPPVRRKNEPRDEPPPATPSKRKQEEPSPEDLRRADRARDDEPPPGAKREDKRNDKRVDDEPPPARRRADREDKREDKREEDEPPRRKRRSETRDDQPRVSNRPKKPPHGNNYVDARVRFGFLKVGQQTRTNGTSSTLLTNYEYATTHLAVAAQLGYSRAIGNLRIHIDGKYLVGLLGSVLFDARGDGTVTTQLAVLNQQFGGGIGVGGFWNVAGGIDLRLRLGADIWVNQISPSNAPISISQNILLSMAIGLEFAMPEAVYFGGRPFGFRIKGGALAPGTRLEQPNLRTATDNTTLGGYVGAEIGYGLLTNVKRGQLFLAIGYDFNVHFTHFTGQCPATTSETNRVCRDDTVDDANTSNVAHLGTLGLYYQY